MRMIVRLPWLLASLFCVLTRSPLMAASTLIEEVVGELPPMTAPSDPLAFVVSPDAHHVAYRGGEGSRQQMIVDDRAGPLYQRVGSSRVQVFEINEDPLAPERPPQFRVEQRPWVFTGQGDELVYVAQKETDQHVVVARGGVHYEWPSLGQLQVVTVSPGGHYTYAIYREQIERKTHWRMILNGQVSPPGVNVTSEVQVVAFYEPKEGAPHFAFVGRSQRLENNRQVEYHEVYFDGKPGEAFSYLNAQQSPPRFALIDGRLAVVFLARRQGEQADRVVLQYGDGETQVSEPVVANSLRFGEEGTSVGWMESPPPDRGQRFTPDATVPVKIVLNGEERYRFEASLNEPRQLGRLFRISPDGSRWALARSATGNGPAVRYVLLDGQRGRDYGNVQQLVFGPDSSRFAYVAYNGGRPFVVDGFQEYGPYGQLSELVFSESGQSLAWYGSHERGGSVFVNGNPVMEDESGRWAWPVRFKPGTEDPVALVTREGKSFLRVGDAEWPIEGPVQSEPLFSEDGAHFAIFGEFSSRRGQRGSHYFVDGEPLPIDSEVVSVGPAAWKGFAPGSGHFVAVAEYRVSEPERRQGGTILVDGHHLEDLFQYSSRDARSPQFLPDGRFRFYGVRGSEILRFTIDPAGVVSYGEAREAAAAQDQPRILFESDDPKMLTSFTDHVIADEDVIYGVGNGGEYGMGMIYRINADGSDFTALHHFLGGGDHAQNPSSLVLGKDGRLYGSVGPNSFFMRQPKVAGGFFRLGTDGSDYEVFATYPYRNTFRTAPVLDAVLPEGALLGRSPVPNLDRVGSDAVMKIDPETGAMSEVYRASNIVEGQMPTMNPIGPFFGAGDGFYYGFNSLSLFRFSVDGGNPVVLHAFRGFPLDGDSLRDLPVSHGEWLYGITGGGGKERLGVLYRMRRDGTAYEVLRHFGRETKLMGLTAGDAGVWGHRLTRITRNGRRLQVPLLERVDVAGAEPRTIIGTGIGGRTWMGTLDGEPALFGVRGNTLFAIGFSSVEAAKLEIERIEGSPLSAAKAEEIELGEL